MNQMLLLVSVVIALFLMSTKEGKKVAKDVSKSVSSLTSQKGKGGFPNGIVLLLVLVALLCLSRKGLVEGNDGTQIKPPPESFPESCQAKPSYNTRACGNDLENLVVPDLVEIAEYCGVANTDLDPADSSPLKQQLITRIISTRQAAARELSKQGHRDDNDGDKYDSVEEEGARLRGMSSVDFRNYVNDFGNEVISSKLSSLGDDFPGNPARGSIISLILNSKKKGVDVQELLGDMSMPGRQAS